MSFWTTPSGAGFRTLDFLVRRLPPVRRLRMELQAAVDYHDYYVTSIDKALGQPRENGDIRSAHMIEIGRLKHGSVTELCADHSNLSEYVRQMEAEIAQLRKVLSEALSARTANGAVDRNPAHRERRDMTYGKQ